MHGCVISVKKCSKSKPKMGNGKQREMREDTIGKEMNKVQKMQ
jgi:hypothetical protein